MSGISFRLMLPALLAFVSQSTATAQPAHVDMAIFKICGSEKRINCVVDGDTFWFKGDKIRIAKIDAPETLHAKCLSEKQLGRRARERLLAWINKGPFQLHSSGADRDRYGRLLRDVSRSGKSVSDMLIANGLARRWTGSRESWCS